jgi:ribonuclease Z
MFHSKLVNDPFGDPAAYVEFMYRKEAVLFDLGDISTLPPRKILKLSHIFISHTHMDHFIGFDHLLRVCLGRDQHVHIYGPPGFIPSLGHKISAYNWNLVENYTNDLVIHAHEIDSDGNMTQCKYRCQTAFRPEPEEKETARGFVISENDFFSVSCMFLDHKIPSLAYRLDEKKRVNVMKNNLQAMGLPIGPWLTELKDSILQDKPDNTPIIVWWREGGSRREGDTLPLGLLREKLIKITPGESLSYVADALYHAENVQRILKIAQKADHLFIEACFLESDARRAKEKYHLTAAQAGRLARDAGVKRITLFLFSPKYQGQGELLLKEAMAAFSSS